MHSSADYYCVMGNPVAHSRSPWIHGRFAELTGQSLRYERLAVPLESFAAAVADFQAQGGRGCNITVPFKHQAAQLAQTASERVQLAGAANTLVFSEQGMHADNTDGLGLVADITANAGVSLTGRAVLLLGAGGAAAGALGALLAEAPARLVVANRSLDKAQALVERHDTLARLHGCQLLAQPQQAVDGDFDIVINATSSSLAGAAVPVHAQVLRPGCLAYDMMYGPAAHGFLDWARNGGATARDGLGMLVEQAAQSFWLWRGIRPPSAQVLSELRTQLALAP